MRYLAELGRILSNGEILQLNSISNEEISEDIYIGIEQLKKVFVEAGFTVTEIAETEAKELD